MSSKEKQELILSMMKEMFYDEDTSPRMFFEIEEAASAHRDALYLQNAEKVDGE